MSTLDDLKNILRSRAGFETVNATDGPAQLRIEGRVPPNASSHWVLIVHRLLVCMDQRPWKVDISKRYFIRDLKSGPKMFYAWRLIFQADNIAEQIQDIILAVDSAPRPARVELQEFPLTGESVNRNQLQNGKGAGSVDRMPLGPMAAANAMASRVRQ